MLLPVKDIAGEQVGEIEVSDAVFAGPVNKSLMHQALVRQLANARLGTHSTKTRGQVAGGGRKPWRQKGTGRARQGSTRSPNWVGGGTVFGPQPRSYARAMPRKMRRAALCSALSVKVGAGEVVVVDNLMLSVPKTKEMRRTLEALGADDQSVLMVMAEKDVNVQRSANNLPRVKTLLSSYVNIRDLLGHDLVLLSRDAVAQLEAWLDSDVGAAAGDGAEETVAASESADIGQVVEPAVEASADVAENGADDVVEDVETAVAADEMVDLPSEEVEDEE